MTIFDPSLPPRLQTQRIGHEKAWEFFTQNFADNTLHPAWLLVGGKGIGKATFAFQAARHILKAHQNNDQFFDTLINQNAHPNLLLIEREKDEEGKVQNDITIEAVRKIANFVQQSPAFPGWRVIIIDAIDELNRHAANALLKMLEEPPAKVVFFLVCHRLGHILPTIRSRCCLMPMVPPPFEKITSLLDGSSSPLARALANKSVGRLHDLQQFDLNQLAEEVIKGIRNTLNNNLTPVQAFLESLDKADPRFRLINELLRWLAYHLVLISHGVYEVEEFPFTKKIQEIAPLKGKAHWLDVQEKLTLLLDEAQGAYLDEAALILAAFLCFESPHLVQL